MYPAGAVIERHGFLFKIYRCSEPPSSKDNRLYGQGLFFYFSKPLTFENNYLEILSK